MGKDLEGAAFEYPSNFSGGPEGNHEILQSG
jgi:hypothetical protein